MKLAELDASFVGLGGDGSPVPVRKGVGLALRCPCGSWTCNRLYVPFANPIDGLGAVPGESRGWHREGDSLETLTLTPSVLRMSECGWHGWIRGGEATSC